MNVRMEKLLTNEENNHIMPFLWIHGENEVIALRVKNFQALYGMRLVLL